MGHQGFWLGGQLDLLTVLWQGGVVLLPGNELAVVVAILGTAFDLKIPCCELQQNVGEDADFKMATVNGFWLGHPSALSCH